MSAELVKKAAERNASAKLNREAGMPEVGIFWIVNGKIVADSIPWRDTPSYEGWHEGKNDHLGLFETLKRIMPELMNHDSSDFPRGRVMYNEMTQEFVCYASNATVANSAVKRKIIREFQLPSAKTTFVQDAR